MTTKRAYPPEFEQISDTALMDCVEAACKKIPPLWPLDHFVAVNPFVGMGHLDFEEALDVVHRATHEFVTLPGSYFAKAWKDQTITEQDLHQACKNLGCEDRLPSILEQPPDQWPQKEPDFSVADVLDAEGNTRWEWLTVEEVSKWCAAYFDEGQSLWQMPWKHLPLFRAWKRGAEMDRTPEVHGLSGFRSHIKSLPDDALLAIEVMLASFDVPVALREDYLFRLLMSVRGWAGYVQYLVREKEMRGGSDESLIHLLAIRLAYDATLHKAFRAVPRLTSNRSSSPCAEAIWQEALEISHRRNWIGQLKPANKPEQAAPPERPSLQAVFCIDVRSEVMRRALESADPLAETIGFAGFFGFVIEVVPVNQSRGAARCPVLLIPSHRVQEHLPGSDEAATQLAEARLKTSDELAGNWKSFKTASITSFSFVESLGLASAAPLLRESLVMAPAGEKQTLSLAIKKECCSQGDLGGLTLEDRVAMAVGALLNMGLTKNFARVVVLCGHGSQSANNPFASSLDCGACGGHAGDANARVAAMVLNDPAVRSALPSKGIVIPKDTVFLAALHNTCTDEITLFDLENMPATHFDDVKSLRQTLLSAGHLVRAERAIALGVDPLASGDLLKSLVRRSYNWAEVRPEWGLAGNHAFIAAPRILTKNLNLEGKAFLHNYNSDEDPDFKILELILCAPLVVASWINLQYFASASNNDLFGSGNKLLHNVVGKMGVLEGNGGDLRAGLPWQSVHDGTKLMHTPLRLNVFIKAPPEAMDDILTKHESVANLVNHRWLHMFALENDKILHRHPNGGWQPIS